MKCRASRRSIGPRARVFPPSHRSRPDVLLALSDSEQMTIAECLRVSHLPTNPCCSALPILSRDQLQIPLKLTEHSFSFINFSFRFSLTGRKLAANREPLLVSLLFRVSLCSRSFGRTCRTERVPFLMNLFHIRRFITCALTCRENGGLLYPFGERIKFLLIPEDENKHEMLDARARLSPLGAIHLFTLRLMISPLFSVFTVLGENEPN